MLRTQLIYKLNRLVPFSIESPQGVRFTLLCSPLSCIGHIHALTALLGGRELVKLLLKLCTPSRRFFVLRCEDAVVHFGSVAIGFCKLYDVGEGTVVIGPVETVESARGKGYASIGLRLLLNALMQDGFEDFYIDTGEGNPAMQKVIGKCGFELLATTTKDD